MIVPAKGFDIAVQGFAAVVEGIKLVAPSAGGFKNRFGIFSSSMVNRAVEGLGGIKVIEYGHGGAPLLGGYGTI